MLNTLQHERYSRQIALPEIGEAGQEKLVAAKVLVIGAGGLGCPLLQYLAAAGVGHLGIADDDIVSVSNLHRQVLYSMDDVGKFKAGVAAKKLEKINPATTVITWLEQVTNSNGWEMIEPFDLVVDGSDNFSTRYMLNDLCKLLNKPWVHGSIFRFEGKAAVFNHMNSANYRDVFATPPVAEEVPNCSEAGVIGVLPGIIGSLMANEVIKLITGIGHLLTDKLLTYNALTNSFYEMEFESSGTCKNEPADRTAFEAMDYGFLCHADKPVEELETNKFYELLTMEKATIIDVRDAGETPLVRDFHHLHIPLKKLLAAPPALSTQTIVLFCQTGKRSRQAARFISKHYPKQTVYSLKGGIEQWQKKQKTKV